MLNKSEIAEPLSLAAPIIYCQQLLLVEKPDHVEKLAEHSMIKRLFTDHATNLPHCIFEITKPGKTQCGMIVTERPKAINSYWARQEPPHWSGYLAIYDSESSDTLLLQDLKSGLSSNQKLYIAIDTGSLDQEPHLNDLKHYKVNLSTGEGVVEMLSEIFGELDLLENAYIRKTNTRYLLKKYGVYLSVLFNLAYFANIYFRDLVFANMFYTHYELY